MQLSVLSLPASQSEILISTRGVSREVDAPLFVTTTDSIGMSAMGH